MRDLAHIAARVFNTPLLIHPRKAEVIASVLAERMSGITPMIDVRPAKEEAVALRADHAQMLDRFDGERRGPVVKDIFGGSYVQTRYLFSDGVALITAEGSLVNRGAWIGPNMSGLTSYEGLMAQLGSAAADRDVSALVMDMETPGGEASGVMELAAFIRTIVTQKPVYAIVNGMAASAGYAIASAATRLITTPSGVSGSIGVVMLHLDRSRQIEKAGITPTLIYAGGHKVDGNPFEPLPDDVRADLQAEVAMLYELFVESVAAGRSKLSPAAIKATEARHYTGREAVEIGLADEIGTLAELVEDLSSRGMRRLMPKGLIMSNTNGGSAADAGITQAAFDQAVINARQDGHAAGEKAGRVAATTEMLTAMGTLFGDDPRASAFVEMMGDGVSPAAAAKHAAKLAPKADAGLLAEMAAIKHPATGNDGGSDAQLSPMQKGALEAKKLMEIAGGLPSAR